MRLLWIPSSLEAKAILYYRCVLPASRLESSGIYSKHLAGFAPKSPHKRITLADWKNTVDFSRINKSHAIALGRYYSHGGGKNLIFTQVLEHAIRNFKGKILYDTDDMIWDMPFKKLKDDYKPSREFTEYLWKRADVLTASTPYLANQLSKKTGREVLVTPNCVEKQFWLKDKRENEIPQLLYCCSGTHWDEVKFIESIVKKAKQKVSFEATIISPYNITTDKSTFDRSLSWVPFDKYSEYLQELSPDIYIAPIVKKTPFMLSKSNLKFLEAGMLSAAPIVEKCAIFDDLPNEVAIKSLGKKEWISAIVKLVGNKTYMKEMGERANKYVLKNFNIDTECLQKWEKAINLLKS